MSKKVLILEDEEEIAMLISSRLKGAGFETHIFYDALQSMVHIRKNQVDLIILDLMLPGGGGESFLENIKMSMKTQNIPIIVLTGKRDEAIKQKVLDKGVNAYLEKPFDGDQLLKTIQAVLDGC